MMFAWSANSAPPTYALDQKAGAEECHVLTELYAEPATTCHAHIRS